MKYNTLLKLIDGKSVEVEDEDIYKKSYHTLLNQRITINGVPLPDGEVIDSQDVLFVIKDSHISQLYFLQRLELAEGKKITLRKNDFNRINIGDEILYSSEYYPIEDGDYKIKALNKWLRIHDQVVVKTYGLFIHLYLKYCKRIC